MAKILLRASFNEEGYRGAVADPKDREAAARKLVNEAGLQVEAFYYSPTALCQFVIMEGDIADLAAAEFAFMSSGAFKTAEANFLITGAEMNAAQSRAGSMVAKYDAPNRDEIDRMLLDE